MSKLAILATIKVVPGKRQEYLKHLKDHARRCLTREPGTLNLDILVPQEQDDTIVLYEVYESPEAFEAHWNGPSRLQCESDVRGLKISGHGARCELVA